VLAAIGLYVVIAGTGIFLRGRVGREIDRAIAAGQNNRAIALLRLPLDVAVSRIRECPLRLAVSLMVLRQGA
jgi:hypothetical protein